MKSAARRHPQAIDTSWTLPSEGWIHVFALLAALLILLAGVQSARAAQQRMAPTGLGADGCDWNGGACAVANVDEDPDGTGTDWEPATDNNSNHFGHFTFDTPSDPLTTGANLQEFRASVRKNATCGSGTPTARIELWQSGAQVRAGAEVSVTAANSCTQGTNCQVLSFTWNASEVGSAANVEVKVFGTKSGGAPASRCAVDLGAVEWNAEVTVGGSVPTLSSPSVSAVDTTTATLGATIDSGAPILQRGTVWNTSGAPVLPEGQDVEGGTATGAFSHGVTGLPVGTRIYFRGYATNANGAGYSADGSFYTEPNPATSATLSNITSSGMRVSWTLPGSGAGDGTLVVMKQGPAVTASPSDGTFSQYAPSAVFGSGWDLGGGNYVIFRGSGTQVDVSGLAPATEYSVAVYQYAGSADSLVNYQQTSPPTATDSTSAGGSAPTLSSPTVSAVAATSATLGATITSGAPILERGTVWNTTGAPTVPEGQGVEGGTATGAFSHARTGLPQASQIFYRGYAVNAGGTGYSPEDSFYTEPATQASRVRIDSALDGELAIRWTAGSGDGSIVLLKLATPVDTDPSDGVVYLGDTAFGSGDQLGTGNYVVYVGAGTQVTVTGLASDQSYHVAVYEYAGAGSGSSGINYLQLSPARSASGHNGAHGIQCVECHFGTGDLHGNFQVPRDSAQDAICKTCHNDTGPASAKINVALHTGTTYGVVVDCGSCHEVHNEPDLVTNDAHSGGITTSNVEWIRPNTSKYVAAALEPALFQANTGFFAYDDGSAPWNGICQTCHTNTDRHRNNNSPANPHSHEVTSPCTDCHAHDGVDGDGNGFSPSGGACPDCHKQPKEIGTSGVFRRRITESSAGVGDGEFASSFRSHHVNNGTGSQVVTKWDCVVCHAEGDVDTASPDSNFHKKDGVQLKNVDTGVAYSNWSDLAPAKRSEFCLSCHDVDGATIITGRTDPDLDATTDALNPFNDGVTNAHEPAGLDGSAAPHTRGAVIDVAGQFDTLNASHHAVLGAAYGSATPFGSGVDNAIQGVRTDLAWNSVLNCEDCHYGSVDTKLSGHGTANARYMLRDRDGNDTLATGGNIICYRCHNPADSVSTYPEHDKSAHIDDALNLYGISCLNCHGGGEWGGIHGVDALVVDDDGAGSYTPNVFTYGSGLDYISNWTSWANRGVSCSSKAGATKLNACDHHGSTEWARGETRSYRAP